jgi:hypothetical protein
MLVVLEGPSGVGKTTLARAVSKRLALPVHVTYTTRPARQGEVDGEDYHFVTPEAFAALSLAESTVFNGYAYGTTYPPERAITVLTREGIERIKRIMTVFTVHVRTTRTVDARGRAEFPTPTWSFTVMNDVLEVAVRDLVKMLSPLRLLISTPGAQPQDIFDAIIQHQPDVAICQVEPLDHFPTYTIHPHPTHRVLTRVPIRDQLTLPRIQVYTEPVEYPTGIVIGKSPRGEQCGPVYLSGVAGVCEQFPGHFAILTVEPAEWGHTRIIDDLPIEKRILYANHPGSISFADGWTRVVRGNDGMNNLVWCIAEKLGVEGKEIREGGLHMMYFRGDHRAVMRGILSKGF